MELGWVGGAIKYKRIVGGMFYCIDRFHQSAHLQCNDYHCQKGCFIVNCMRVRSLNVVHITHMILYTSAHFIQLQFITTYSSRAVYAGFLMLWYSSGRSHFHFMQACSRSKEK